MLPTLILAYPAVEFGCKFISVPPAPAARIVNVLEPPSINSKSPVVKVVVLGLYHKVVVSTLAPTAPELDGENIK